MKKILLAFLMLCTALSAWSYTEETVTIRCNGTNTSPFTVNAQSGSDGADGASYWEIRNGYNLKLKAKQSYYITKVEFTQTGDNVETWDKLQRYTPKSWVRPSGDTDFYDVITFSNEYSFTKVTSITVTYYHVCYGATHHDAVSGTCTTKGTAEYWECVCGKIHSDADCTNEVTDMAMLATEINPKNHINDLQECQRMDPTCIATGTEHHWHCADCGQDFSDKEGITEISSENLIIPIDPTYHAVTLTKIDAVPATCVSEGNIEHWYCSACYHLFLDEAGTNMATKKQDLILPIDPTNHASLEEVAGKNASLVEDGVYRHWHCDACGNDYADANGTENMTGQTVKARYDADALLIGNSTVDESYLFNGAKVTFDGDQVNLAIGSDNHQYELSETERLMISFAHTFKLKANQDPDSKGDYYATFYTSEGAYKVPSGAKAYTGNVKTTADPDVDALVMTDTEGLIHKSEPVILKASQSDITLMPSVNKAAATADNALTGTDKEITLGANDFALTLGQNGVGFYLWEGKEIASNKAYLTLDPSSQVKALIFVFDDDDPTADSINSVDEDENENENEDGNMYNLSGLRVDENYKGIVIKNGKKYLVR